MLNDKTGPRRAEVVVVHIEATSVTFQLNGMPLRVKDVICPKNVCEASLFNLSEALYDFTLPLQVFTVGNGPNFSLSLSEKLASGIGGGNVVPLLGNIGKNNHPPFHGMETLAKFHNAQSENFLFCFAF